MFLFFCKYRQYYPIQPISTLKGMKLPVYALEIEEGPDSEFQVDFVAMVDKPAIQANWVAFNEPQKFAADDEQKVIFGPAMIPDMLIYRKDEKFGEYNVVFTKDQIKKIALQFFEKGYQKNINLMHQDGMTVEGVTIFQSLVSDEKNGIKGIGDYPDGTWFLGAKVNNAYAWELVKQEKLKGWSIEGLFKYRKIKMEAVQVYNAIAKLLENI